jgi:hypothetical protein
MFFTREPVKHANKWDIHMVEFLLINGLSILSLYLYLVHFVKVPDRMVMRTLVSVGGVDECVHGTERFMMNCWLFAAGAVLAPCTCVTHVLTHTQDWLSPIGSPALHLSGSLT